VYIRYEFGIVWGANNAPIDAKEFYVVPSGDGTPPVQHRQEWHGVFGYTAGPTYDTTLHWNDIMGGGTGFVPSDGLFHLFEGRILYNGPNGEAETRIDGVNLGVLTGITWNSGPITAMTTLQFSGNQKNLNNGRSIYSDYDDIVIATGDWVGPYNAERGW
jgi:hypothetical protein